MNIVKPLIIISMLMGISIAVSWSIFHKKSSPSFMLNKEVIEKVFNRKADEFPDEQVLKIVIPRTDITTIIQNRPLDPFMGLTTWFAFQQGKKAEAMVMGDIVLQEHEVFTAMKTALENNIQITALHNHFFFDRPKIYFMHLEGEGTPEALAQGCMQILQSITQAQKVSPLPISSAHAIDGSIVEKIMGVKGQAKNGMFKVVIGRTTQMHDGSIVGKNMGVNTWAAFGGTNDAAIVDGDFAVLENELQAVLVALLKSGFNVVAIHNHMILENPRLLFVHFWGEGNLADLAQGLKKALETTTSKP